MAEDRIHSLVEENKSLKSDVTELSTNCDKLKSDITSLQVLEPTV